MGDPTDSCALYWLRNDLRLQDNQALAYALRHHRRVLCVYLDERSAITDPSAADWWRHQALSDLAEQLHGRLLYRRGEAQAALSALLREYPIEAVYWNRDYDPLSIARDSAIKARLKSEGVSVASFAGNLLFEPWELLKPDGAPYRVFTPYYKAGLKRGWDAPVVCPALDDALMDVRFALPESCSGALSAPWSGSLAAHWEPTRRGALLAVDRFVEQRLVDYPEQRDLPGTPGCSRLSPYLRHGQLGVRELVSRVDAVAAGRLAGGSAAYVRELLWREFAHAVLYHWPETLGEPMDLRFRRMPWRNDTSALQAWRLGRTGVPLVDAGMRELWQTGYMHNRVRMVVASYLSKHLMIDWRRGAEWFLYTLVDADLANNTLGWQWTAGSGVDAAPYFRIFNPVSQGERFDPAGAYVRRWVPELSRLPDKWVHRPWMAPAPVLCSANVRMGENYPEPLLDLSEGRKRALQVWEQIRI